jgi:integrase
VLQADEARTLIDAIDTTSLPGLRDRALIGLMVYTLARVGAAISMRVEDFYVQGRRLLRVQTISRESDISRLENSHIGADPPPMPVFSFPEPPLTKHSQ